jgi:hypothetical protein
MFEKKINEAATETIGDIAMKSISDGVENLAYMNGNHIFY